MVGGFQTKKLGAHGAKLACRSCCTERSNGHGKRILWGRGNTRFGYPLAPLTEVRADTPHCDCVRGDPFLRPCAGSMSGASAGRTSMAHPSTRTCMCKDLHPENPGRPQGQSEAFSIQQRRTLNFYAEVYYSTIFRQSLSMARLAFPNW